MRLAQLSRKLNIKPSEIVSFIEENFNEKIENDRNTKISSDFTTEIINHFDVSEDGKPTAPIDAENKVDLDADKAPYTAVKDEVPVKDHTHPTPPPEENSSSKEEKVEETKVSNDSVEHKSIEKKNVGSMRLAQLSRKLNIKPSEIIFFVKNKLGEELEHARNTKISDYYTQKIIHHFDLSEDGLQTPPLNTKNETELDKEKAPNTAIDDVSPIKDHTHPTPPPEENPSSIEEKVEETKVDDNLAEQTFDENGKKLIIEDGVIKSPPVEVEGIKVVGKVELPGKKTDEPEEEKPEEEVVQEEESSEKPVSTDDRKSKKTKKQKNKKQKSSRSHEESKTLEQKNYKKKLEEQRKRDKKAKRKNYERMMDQQEKNQNHAPKKKVKKATKKESVQHVKEETPKTGWGKFIKWLNT